MTVLQSIHSLYCTKCFTEKRIFLSTSKQEIESFRDHHELCLSDREKLKESYPAQLQDWKDRTGQKI